MSNVDNKKETDLARPAKLLRIKLRLNDILSHTLRYGYVSDWKLPYVVVRENSFSRFAAETQSISAVNGICELELYTVANMEFQTLSPLTIKKLTTGSAKASKDEVAQSLDVYCPQHPEFQCDDESDAMATAVAWLIDNGYIEQKPLDK